MNELHAEIERLSRELDQASSEKIQSAQYGLGLLEEKSLLEHKCEELETLYDNTRHELDITQEVSIFDQIDHPSVLSVCRTFFFCVPSLHSIAQCKERDVESSAKLTDDVIKKNMCIHILKIICTTLHLS